MNARAYHTPRMCAPLHTPGNRIAVEDSSVRPTVPASSSGSGGRWRGRSPALRRETRRQGLRADAQGGRTTPQPDANRCCRRERPEANMQ
jgi:hypothetical protein